jgi:hypothetical protein
MNHIEVAFRIFDTESITTLFLKVKRCRGFISLHRFSYLRYEKYNKVFSKSQDFIMTILQERYRLCNDSGLTEPVRVWRTNMVFHSRGNIPFVRDWRTIKGLADPTMEEILLKCRLFSTGICRCEVRIDEIV